MLLLASPRATSIRVSTMFFQINDDLLTIVILQQLMPV